MRALLITPERDSSVTVELRERIESIPGFQPPLVTDHVHALSTVQVQKPDLAIVVLSAASASFCLETIRRLRSAGALHLMVAGPPTDAKLILKCMQAGAEVFLDQTELGTELHSALYRVHMRHTNPDEPGRIYAVLSTAGGCGASTIALNLAVAIARNRGLCNLIDLNLDKADLAPLLDLKPAYTLADLCRHDERLDSSLYEKLLTRHSSGVALLAAPPNIPGDGEFTAESICRAIDVASETFTDIVVDLETSNSPEQMYVLGKASKIFLVNRLDFTSVRHTRRILDQLESEGIPRHRVEIVVNQYREGDALPVSEAEDALGIKLGHFIPTDPAIIGAANNLGVPAALSHPDSPVVQSIVKLVGLDTPVPPGPSRLSAALDQMHAGLQKLKGFGQRIRSLTQSSTVPQTSITRPAVVQTR